VADARALSVTAILFAAFQQLNQKSVKSYFALQNK
jgi:hypothetical protein